MKAVLPLKDPDDHKTIERFLQTSDYLVDHRAKHAAIYSFGERFRFNWRTKVVETVEEENSTELN